jgi:hypothetical protein
MVRHQAVRVHPDTVALNTFCEEPLERYAVTCAEEDALVIGAAIHHVVPAVLDVVSRSSWHARILT